MIGFNHLGRLGQLGNQMFQYASLKGISNIHGYEFTVPKHEIPVNDGLGNLLHTELFNVFEIECNTGMIETETYIRENGFEYNQDFVDKCPDKVSLVGFFQTEKYFKHIEDEIRKDFTFKKTIKDECQEILNEVFTDRTIALHIRRGDFLINSLNHHNLDMKYYEDALKKFDSDREVVIFSDDPDWVGSQELFESDRFIISNGTGPYHDLYLMSQCKDFIIANSTFSWWGAWLSNTGRVIAPSTWFGPNNAHLNTKDLYPDHWEVIDG